MQTSINELIEKYANIATSTIGHVLDEGHLAQIHAINRIHHVTGRVRTATLASINAMNLRDALLQSEPNDVLVIDARAIPNRACWGEQRHRAAIYHQLAAVVVIGDVTDCVALREMKLPVFARSVSCLTTRHQGESLVEHGQDIVVGQTRIASGDLMIGDADGVFILSPEIAQDLWPTFQDMEEQEQHKRHHFFNQYHPRDYYHAEQRR
ncbi:RraA family protein [uncultured Acinetobacter sp.]|uniref:RraA family protein n=1 Tax=uncultured Acinetobacter sp. TaxID=165433 RepID=UPI00258DD726|nr:RraA family protein [uncultured Acinetobacter sp.]